MGSLLQVRVGLSGLKGLPGVNTFYFTGPATTALNDLKAFYEFIKAGFPTAMTITYPGTGMIIDDLTGQATGTWSGTAPAATVGTNVNPYSAPVGAVVNWRTGLFTAGRELRGKTFLVPLCGTAYGTDGNMTSAFTGTIQSAAGALRNSTAVLTVFSPTHHQSGPVTSATVPSKAVVLRSRRD